MPQVAFDEFVMNEARNPERSRRGQTPAATSSSPHVQLPHSDHEKKFNQERK